VPNGVVFGFAASPSVGAPNAAISRISDGVIGVGTGAAGSFAGSLKLTNLTAVGTPTSINITGNIDCGNNNVDIANPYNFGIKTNNVTYTFFAQPNAATVLRGYADTYPVQLNPTGGGVLIQETTPVASSVLTVSSTTQGLLPPRMTTTQKDAISSPAEGLIVYDLTLHKLCLYTGSAWETITSL